MLAELETQGRKEARREFVAAVWEGEVPWRLLAMAKAAGLSGDEADAFMAKVAQAKEQFVKTNRLPRLRKEAARLKAQHDKIHSRASEEISRLEAEVQDAALEADAAQRAVYEAEECSRQLLAMYDAGELPATEAPEEVFRHIERREAEEHCRRMDTARAAAQERRDNIRAVVRNIEQRLADLPLAVTSVHEESVLENRLKDARRQLAEAESALKKAESAEDTARKAIP